MTLLATVTLLAPVTLFSHDTFRSPWHLFLNLNENTNARIYCIDQKTLDTQTNLISELCKNLTIKHDSFRPISDIPVLSHPPSDKKDPSSHAAICIVCTFRYLRALLSRACARASKLAWSKVGAPVPHHPHLSTHTCLKWQYPKINLKSDRILTKITFQKKKCCSQIFNCFWGKSSFAQKVFFSFWFSKVGQVSKNCYELRVSRLSCTCTQVFILIDTSTVSN